MTRAVLVIDTAAPEVGVGIVPATGEPRLRSARMGRGADAWLMPEVAACLAHGDAQGWSLCGVAVAVGPGTFTGLRVGVSAATGVAVARRAPVFTVGSLQARALDAHGPLLVLLDARKKRFYGAMSVDGALVGEPVDAPLDTILASVAAGTAVTGEGAVVAQDALLQAGLTIREQAAVPPLAAIGAAALEGALPSFDAAHVTLRYVRRPDATPPKQLAGIGRGRAAH